MSGVDEWKDGDDGLDLNPDNLENLDLDNKETPAASGAGGQATIDKSQLEKHIYITLSLQDVNEDVISVDRSFYNSLHDYKGLINGHSVKNMNLWLSVDDFISFRLERILSHSISFSGAVAEKLSLEEHDLYKKICNLVDDYREQLSKKIREG